MSLAMKYGVFLQYIDINEYFPVFPGSLFTIKNN
jgi:hypothetical protein